MDKVRYDMIDMFDFNNENNILNIMLMFLGPLDRSIKLLNNNLFEKEILRYIENIRSFNENNGHDCLPPDYYSDDYSCMFDVFRINDSENKKGKNPILAEENNLRNEYKKEGLLDLHNVHFIFEANSSGNDNTHTYVNYKKQAQRVIKMHIDKIPIWEKEHPDIKYKGLFIFDESGLCYEKDEDEDNIYVNIIHHPWDDKELMQIIYESKIDFVIWFCPNKHNSNILYECNKNNEKKNKQYPAITIVDTRFKRTDYAKYNYDELVMEVG